jgi:hypothetical protein
VAVPSSIPREVEEFVAATFDSEESLMVALALHKDGGSMAVQSIVRDMTQALGYDRGSDPERLVIKRIELRLRDLVAKQLVAQEGHGMYRYTPATAAISARMDEVAALFTTARNELDRVIYSGASRALRLAEAFRF